MITISLVTIYHHSVIAILLIIFPIIIFPWHSLFNQNVYLFLKMYLYCCKYHRCPLYLWFFPHWPPFFPSPFPPSPTRSCIHPFQAFTTLWSVFLGNAYAHLTFPVNHSPHLLPAPLHSETHQSVPWGSHFHYAFICQGTIRLLLP